jgi:hypothetical protein
MRSRLPRLHHLAAACPSPLETHHRLQHTGLLPGCLSQRFIDPILPARPGFLEVFKNVPINAQRDELFGIRESRCLRSRFRRLRCCCLKRSLGRMPWVACSSCSVDSHLATCIISAIGQSSHINGPVLVTFRLGLPSEPEIDVGPLCRVPWLAAPR